MGKYEGGSNNLIFLLLRHGKTLGNSQGRYIGYTDESLSDEGIKEIIESSKSISFKPSLVYTSGMKRCRETMNLIWPEVECREIEELREIDFGLFEGKNYRDLQGNPDYQSWIDSNGELPFPRGESREAFIERVMKGFSKALEECKKDSEGTKTNIGLIVHGGTIMAIMSSLFSGNYFDYQVKNGRGYEVTWDCADKNWKYKGLE